LESIPLTSLDFKRREKPLKVFESVGFFRFSLIIFGKDGYKFKKLESILLTSLDYKRREKTVKVAIKYLNLVDSFVSL
jgi:hypothetical protein